jgi:trk system potassium uptake protein TrkH
MNLILLVLFTVSFLVDLVWGDLDLSNIYRFTIPFGISFLLYMPHMFSEGPAVKLNRRARYIIGVLGFLYLVFMGSMPFMISGEVDPITAFFESMAGFTTTGISTYDPASIIESGHGLMFFRVAIQWIGGLYYLVFAFMFLSDLADVAKRSAERRLFSRIGLIPNLSSLLQNLTMIYGIFTITSFLAFYISGGDLFDSICLSLSTISTGGFTSTGRVIDQGSGIHMITAFFMFLAAMGFYVHMSIFSAKGRRKTILDTENISYFTICFLFPMVVFIILLFDGMGSLSSLWKGIFTAVSAISTTGFMIDGMESWPDSIKFLLLLLMLVGGSSLSLASGLKVQRALLLIKGFLGEVRRSSHPNAVVTLRRGEGTYSEKALESANMTFFYLLGLLGITIIMVLMFRGDLFNTMSLCVTAVSNSGMAFGEFATPEGISSLNWFVKLGLSGTMLLGRFEILLPLYVLTMRSVRYDG